MKSKSASDIEATFGEPHRELSEDSQRLIDRWLESCWIEKGLSDATLSSYRSDIEMFARWCRSRDSALTDVSAGDIQAFLAHRLIEKKSSQRSTARFLSCCRGFYRWMVRENNLREDPTALVEGPKQGRRLPKTLSERDVERLRWEFDIAHANWKSGTNKRATKDNRGLTACDEKFKDTVGGVICETQ